MTVRRLVCTAEPFGYGPSSSLAQIVSRMQTLAGEIEATYIGSGHTLDFAHAIPAYGGRVEAGVLADRLAGADAALIVTDFAAAAAACRAGVPFAIYDPLAWYWPVIPEVCRTADLYVCQDFFGVRARLADAGIDNAVVIPPLTPELAGVQDARSGILVSLGGLGNPYFTAARCVDYARAVLSALQRATAGEPGPVTSLTSKQIAESLPGLEVATLPPDEVHRRIAAARVCFLTPGLGQLYEAAALDARVVWLPPANDSQGRQLREVVARDMAPGAIDWHQVLDVPRVDYEAPQDLVMRTLSSHMDRLLRDPRAQARLAAVVRTRMLAVRDAPTNPLTALAIETGRGGAVVAGRIFDAWLRTLDERVRPTSRLGDASPPPAPPRLRPLIVPRENRADDRVLEPLRALHAEINGRGLHTLGGALEVVRETQRVLASRGASRPTCADIARALASWRASGFAVWARYGAGNCVAHAEVLRARIQRELGLSSQLVCVRYADSKRPLDHGWEYTGTVHADLLVPFRDGDRTRAVHIVCGTGVAGQLHALDDETSLLAHLGELGYASGAVVDPGELTRLAFGIKDRWWIVEGPEISEGCKLGIDVVTGTVFLDGRASARHRGPRPPGTGNVAVPLAWARAGGTRELIENGRAVQLPAALALRAVVEAMRCDFAQPEDFTDLVMFLAEHLDVWCQATLCEPGASLRAAHRRAQPGYDEPSVDVVAMLAHVDAGDDPLALAVACDPDPRRPRALVVRRVRDHVRALRELPRSATRARHAMAAELVRLAAALPPPDVEAPEQASRPSVLDVVPPAGEDETIAGVRFHAARRVYVPSRVSETVVHALHLRLAQFLEWELDGLAFAAPRALVERLIERAIDPATGRALVDGDRVADVVAAIGEVAHLDDPIARIADAPIDLWLTASRGGDRPEQLAWSLPPATAAQLYALLDDRRRILRLFELAEIEAAAAASTLAARRLALAAVLEQHRGVPRRHKRVHWAFVNLAFAGQTTVELRRPHGVLPAEATSLEPTSLLARYGDAARTAVRFVLTDRFELNVLGDERYWDTIARWGFPPNHETLAGTRPILASGYLTIERGRIVAIEDDGVMIPGKLGAQLPPIQEVLEALGYDVDLARVEVASLVLDWEAFAAAADRSELPPVPTDAPITEHLASRSHAERPAIAVAWMRGLRGDRDAIVRATAAALRGFRLINVGGRALAAGDLPKGAEWIDDALARYLVRKVMGA